MECDNKVIERVEQFLYHSVIVSRKFLIVAVLVFCVGALNRFFWSNKFVINGICLLCCFVIANIHLVYFDRKHWHLEDSGVHRKNRAITGHNPMYGLYPKLGLYLLDCTPCIVLAIGTYFLLQTLPNYETFKVLFWIDSGLLTLMSILLLCKVFQSTCLIKNHSILVKRGLFNTILITAGNSLFYSMEDKSEVCNEEM